MMMCLGTFVFSLNTIAYQQLVRQNAWRHAKTARVGARNASQYLGPDDETMELSGWVAPELIGSPASLDTLREMADTGRPFSLVDGNGNVYGAYLIASVSDTRSVFHSDGTARRIEFAISLQRAPDDAMGAA